MGNNRDSLQCDSFRIRISVVFKVGPKHTLLQPFFCHSGGDPFLSMNLHELSC